MSIRIRASAALLLGLLATSSSAQRIRLDDSLSPTDLYAVQLSWGPGGANRALNALLSGAAGQGMLLWGQIPNVEIRLDTREHVGQSARIFVSLPPLISGIGNPADLELRWEASGQFLGGAVRPGQSALVFEGTIDEAVTRVVFDFVLALDNEADVDRFDLEPFYELEILP